MGDRAVQAMAFATGKPGTLFWVPFAFPLVAGGILGATLVYLAVRPQWGDQAYLLFIAQRLLDGQRLGIDIVEVNSPLVVWLSVVPVAIGQLLGIGPMDAMQALVVLLVSISVAWSARLLRQSRDADGRFTAWFMLVMLYAVVLHPWEQYGQREHLVVLLTVPYLLMAARRVDGQAVSTKAALAAGACAAIGVLLKPHYALVVLAVEAVVLFSSRRGQSLYRPEMLAMFAAGIAYLVAVWMWAPAYFSKVMPLAVHTYYDFDHVDLTELISPTRVLKLVAVLLVWLAIYRSLEHRALSMVLAVAALAATAAYLVQLKGHDYRIVPAMAFFHMLAGLMVIDCWLKWTRGWPLATRVGAMAGTFAFAAGIAVTYPLQVAKAARGYSDDRITAQKAAGQYIPDGSTVLILSPAVRGFYEEALRRSWKWGSRFDELHMLPVILAAEYSASHDGAAEPAAMLEAADITRSALAADLIRWQPNPVLVDRCHDDRFAACDGMADLRVDLLGWLNRDPAFAIAWAPYVREGQIGPYDLWCRKPVVEVCRQIMGRPATGY